jgi:hypothetical protein
VLVLGEKSILQVRLCGRDKLILSDRVMVELAMGIKKGHFFRLNLNRVGIEPNRNVRTLRRSCYCRNNGCIRRVETIDRPIYLVGIWVL